MFDIHLTTNLNNLDSFAAYLLLRLVHHSRECDDFQFFAVVAHNGRVITHVHITHEHGCVVISKKNGFHSSPGQDVPN